jgi:hypothetical protein
MAAIRFTALATAFEREARPFPKSNVPVSEYFGMNVFDKKKMKKYLPNEA